MASILAVILLASGVAITLAMATGVREVRISPEGVTFTYRKESRTVPWSRISGAQSEPPFLRLDCVDGHHERVALGALPSLPYDLIINAFLVSQDFSRAEVENWAQEMRDGVAD